MSLTSGGSCEQFKELDDIVAVEGGGQMTQLVLAPTSGKITSLYENMIELDHGNGWSSTMYHVIPKSNLQIGDSVEAGDVIGEFIPFKRGEFSEG